MALTDIFRVFGLPLLLLGLIVLFAVNTGAFLTPTNLAGLAQSVAISILLFVGMTWIFTIGEIDVSFVAVAALANMIAAGLVNAGLGWPMATLISLVAALSIGLANGFLVAVMGLPSLITTIATGGIASALAAAVGLGSSVAIIEPSFLQVLFDVRFGIIPLVLIVALLVTAVLWYVQEKLTLGHYVFAMATNPRAVLEAGVPTARITVILFTFSAVLSGFAGVLIAVELSSGQPSIAGSLFIDGLTAVLLGGTMLKLGKPNIIGTVVGVLIIAVLVRGGALLGWSAPDFQIIKGGLLLVGVSVVVWTNRRDFMR